MAQPSRFASGTKLQLIDSYEFVMDTSKKESNKLFVILFNQEFPGRGTIENRLQNWKSNYETSYKVQFYKCITTKRKQDITERFEIEDSPTFIFVRDGAVIARIDDLDEANPDVPNQVLTMEQTKDEKKVKEKLDELCQKP